MLSHGPRAWRTHAVGFAAPEGWLRVSAIAAVAAAFIGGCRAPVSLAQGVAVRGRLLALRGRPRMTPRNGGLAARELCKWDSSSVSPRSAPKTSDACSALFRSAFAACALLVSALSLILPPPPRRLPASRRERQEERAVGAASAASQVSSDSGSRGCDGDALICTPRNAVSAVYTEAEVRAMAD